jgi:hypothetical protein
MNTNKGTDKQTNIELVTIARDIKLEKVDLVITHTPAFQMFIYEPLKSLSSKRKRAIIHER